MSEYGVCNFDIMGIELDWGWFVVLLVGRAVFSVFLCS